jgi:hypothetical protein
VGRKKAAADDEDEDEVAPPPGYVEPPAAWEKPSVAKKVQSILDSLEIPKIDPEARSTLQRWVHRADRLFDSDRGDILLTLRAIAESEGNGPDAIMDPILRAVHSARRPEWNGKGLSFIEAFDRIDLRSLLRQMLELKCFTKSELSTYLATAIRSRLSEIFGPDEVSAPPKKPPVRRSTVRPKGVSERSWNDVLALRKRKPKLGVRAA